MYSTRPAYRPCQRVCMGESALESLSPGRAGPGMFHPAVCPAGRGWPCVRCVRSGGCARCPATIEEPASLASRPSQASAGHIRTHTSHVKRIQTPTFNGLLHRWNSATTGESSLCFLFRTVYIMSARSCMIGYPHRWQSIWCMVYSTIHMHVYSIDLHSHLVMRVYSRVSSTLSFSTLT